MDVVPMTIIMISIVVVVLGMFALLAVTMVNANNESSKLQQQCIAAKGDWHPSSGKDKDLGRCTFPK